MYKTHPARSGLFLLLIAAIAPFLGGHAVANAVGAAIAEVSGETDKVYRDVPRDDALADARVLACDQAVASGAERATLRVVEVEDLPLAYLPGNALRVRVRVVGALAGTKDA